MTATIKDKIKTFKLDGKSIAWKIFQIPSLSYYYKTFSELRIEIGLDLLSKVDLFTEPDEIHFNKKNLVDSYSILFSGYVSFLKLLKFLIVLQITTVVLTFTIYVLKSNLFFDYFLIASVLMLLLTYVILKYQEQKPYKLFKLSLDDETLFCYLYTKRAIYIKKLIGGLDYSFDKIIFRDSDNKTKLFSLSNNIESEIMPFLNKDKWGFKKDDKFIIDCQYDYVESGTFCDMRFSDNGLALVNQKSLYGYIDKNGKTIIDFQYLTGKRFENGFAIVVNLENKYGVIDYKNNAIIDFKYDDIYQFNNDLFVVKLDEKFGLVNTLNNIVLEIIYFEINELVSDRAVVIIKEKEEKYRYINSKGEIIIDPIYKYASDFVGDYAVVQTFDNFDLLTEQESNDFFSNKNFEFDENAGNCGVINKLGNIIIPFEYEEINIYELVNLDLTTILITGSIDEKWGIIFVGSSNILSKQKSLFSSNFSQYNEDVILNEFKDYLKINDFENLNYFKKNNKYGFKDINDEIIIQPTFDNGYSFKNGICIVINNSKYGIINTKGDFLVKMVYDRIWQFDDWVLVSRNDKLFYLDSDGNELAKF